ncbi:uncharacterized protein F5891DRAFT_1059653 [Suillus fuscotomentosus]|uniref:Uncharacterized protein n=1 Tax=Suillus fuscotomentosus TaxID=1912939 RepID=A0AAD4DW83_9AGAM|nr:uncharacterized protein F5891DRAFT_1059653 [Suillus fuscotomentosus]KAG1895225.1 hypothetical protein F5891DRAFT_1059653 [Suillus fuscotomentosus]
MSSPRFAYRRLYLPCITFRVTELRRRVGIHEETISYGVKADGLCDLMITTEDRLTQFSRSRPTRQSFLLVRPWYRYLLELPDLPDEMQSVDKWCDSESQSSHSSHSSHGEQWSDRPESDSRALRLLFRLGQPFAAFLLAQQRGEEYKRIASDCDIIAQVKDVTSVHGMDVKTLEIL